MLILFHAASGRTAHLPHLKCSVAEVAIGVVATIEVVEDPMEEEDHMEEEVVDTEADR